MTARGTVYGFEVHSERPLRYLRAGTGERLEVVEGSVPFALPDVSPVLQWSPPRYPFRAQLFADGPPGRYRLWIAGSGRFHIDVPARRITYDCYDAALRQEERLWGIPSLLCFLDRGDHPLHAAAVEVDGGAVLLAAPGRFGKTTLAAAFVRAGHRLLTEDLSCIRMNGAPFVVPGPAMLRMRHDVAGQLTPPGTERLGTDEDRVHLAADDSTRGDCTPVPLRAICLLRPSDDGVRVERAEPTQALADLWALSFHFADFGDLGRCFDGVAAIADGVPVLDLHRPLTFSHLPEVLDAVRGAALAHV